MVGQIVFQPPYFKVLLFHGLIILPVGFRQQILPLKLLLSGQHRDAPQQADKRQQGEGQQDHILEGACHGEKGIGVIIKKENQAEDHAKGCCREQEKQSPQAVGKGVIFIRCKFPDAAIQKESEQQTGNPIENLEILGVYRRRCIHQEICGVFPVICVQLRIDQMLESEVIRKDMIYEGVKEIIPDGIKGKKGAGIHQAQGDPFPPASPAAQKNRGKKAGQHRKNVKGISHINDGSVKEPAAEKQHTLFPPSGICFDEIFESAQDQLAVDQGYHEPENEGKITIHWKSSPIMDLAIRPMAVSRYFLLQGSCEAPKVTVSLPI